MTLTKRIAAAAAAAAMLAAVFIAGTTGKQEIPVKTEQKNTLLSPSKTLRLWYTDDALTDYVASAALSFYEDTDIRVIPVLTSGLEYLENIYDASVRTREYPDVYLVTNDSLEKAYLAGAASEIQDMDNVVSEENYPTAALQAVTYRGKKIAYPLSFETSVFLYNETYLNDIARKALEAESIQDTDGGSELPAISEDAVKQKAQEMLPKDIAQLLSLADSYDAPEGVEAVFKWDVSDIFYNYFFIGGAICVGGDDGDDPDQIDLYNPRALESLKVYQNMNQFFSINPDEVNYDSVLQEFIDGKVVFSVVTTDAVARLEEAKKEGKFTYEYGISQIPDISEDTSSRSLSVTNTAVVNGYSELKEEANRFAAYLASACADTLYPRAGKVPAHKNVAFENDKITTAAMGYENSMPIPKMVEVSNFWVQMEICFTRVWMGADANEELKKLSEQIRTQLTGAPYTEQYIEEPETQSTEPAEYIDDTQTEQSQP